MMKKKKFFLITLATACACTLTARLAGMGEATQAKAAELPAIEKGEVRVETDTAYGWQAPFSWDHVEIPMTTDGTYDMYQLMATNQLSESTKSTQETHIIVHVEGHGTLADGWYSLGDLRTLGPGATLMDDWASNQHGGLLLIAATKSITSAHITGVYLKTGMTFMKCYTNSGGAYDGYEIGGTIQSDIVLNKEVDAENKVTWKIAQPTAEDEITVTKGVSTSADSMGDSFNDKGLEFSITYNSLGDFYSGGVSQGALTVPYDTEEYYYDSFVSYEYDAQTPTTATMKVGALEKELAIPYGLKVDYASSATIDEKVIIVPFDHSSKFDAYIVAGSDGATNQMDYCSFYIEGVTGTDNGWYTLAQLKEKGLVDGITQWGLQGKIFLNPDGALTANNVKKVYMHEGFEFARHTENSTDVANASKYTVGAVLTYPIVLDVTINNNEGALSNSFTLAKAGAEDTISVEAAGKTTYSLCEQVSKEGLVLKVTLNGLEYLLPASVPYFDSVVTVAGDFSEVGTKQVAVTFGEAQTTYDVEVIDDIESIEIVDGTIPTSTEITVKPDLSDMKVKVSFKGDAEDVEIGYEDVTTDFEFLVAGEQTLTVTYKGKTATKTISVVDADPSTGVNFVNGSSVTVEVATGVMAIRFSLKGVEFINPLEGPYPLYVVDQSSNGLQKISVQISEDYKGDKLEVGEWYTLEELKTVKDASGNPYIGGISQLADSLLIHMESYSWQVNEFTPEHVAAVKIEKGFYFCDYNRSTWGELGHSDYSILKNGVLKTDLLLQKNMIGTNWLRTIAEGDDAITVKSQPTKTQYNLNDTFDYSGLVVHVKYADGFEEDITEFSPTAFKVDMKKAGEQSVRLNLYERSLYFTINISEKTADNAGNSASDAGKDNKDEEGGSCFSSIDGVSVAMLFLLGGAMLVARKRKN